MPFEWSGDIHQAAWCCEALHPFGKDAGSVIPGVFEAYARVFHPIDDDTGARRTWADVAASNRRIAHPEMQLHEISRALGAERPERYDLNVWINRARWGSLPGEELVALGEVLAPHTTTPDRCWACVWEGYGQLHGGEAVVALTRHGAHPPKPPDPASPIEPREALDGPRVEVPGRAYFLLRGPLHEVPGLFDLLGRQSPNIWWPADRAWCVATEIDFAWTYVGGSAATIDAVLADRRLEALPAKVTDVFAHDSDILNATLDS